MASRRRSFFTWSSIPSVRRHSPTWLGDTVSSPEPSQTEFADPVNGTNYALCIYAGTGSTTILEEVNVLSDGTKWTQIGVKGFKYKDKAGSQDGVQKVVLKGSEEPKAKALVKGKGLNLPDPSLGSLPAPITAQLVNQDTGLCWEGVYNAGDVIKNEPEQFKAKAQ